MFGKRVIAGAIIEYSSSPDYCLGGDKKSLASMLSHYCAEHSINIDSWLPG
jgi:hypothetical protein